MRARHRAWRCVSARSGETRWASRAASRSTNSRAVFFAAKRAPDRSRGIGFSRPENAVTESGGRRRSTNVEGLRAGAEWAIGPETTVAARELPRKDRRENKGTQDNRL